MSVASRTELTQDQASNLRMLGCGLARIRGNSVRPGKGPVCPALVCPATRRTRREISIAPAFGGSIVNYQRLRPHLLVDCECEG